MMKRILIVGGANGIGLAVASVLAEREETEAVYVLDKASLSAEYQHPKIIARQFDLCSEDYSLLDDYADIDGLVVTAGFGRLALFSEVSEKNIIDLFNVHAVGVLRVVRRFYERMLSRDAFRCAVMVSIAGFMSSPFFSVYAATKASLKVFIESVNVELEKAGTDNRILNVSPGSIKGTSFNAGATDLEATTPLAREIIERMERGDDLFIPQYEEVFREVLERYHADFRKEGRHSYDYKVERLRAMER